MKPVSFEKTIAKHIAAGRTSSEIAKKIIKDSNVMEVGRFLYNAGLYKQLIQFAIDQLEKEKLAPWPFVIQSLTDHKITISENRAKVLYKNMLLKYEKENSPYIFACNNWGENFQEFDLFRTIFLEKLREENITTKKELLENLAFVQSQDLIEEEEKIINHLLEIEPDNKEYLQHQKDLKEKVAFKFIEKQKQSRQNLYKKRVVPFTSKDTPQKQKFLKTALDVSSKRPEKTRHMAVFLYMMGWPDAGLKLLDTTPSDKEASWFYLEWLMEMRQYTACMELGHQLLDSMDEDPEKLFFINYVMAQALYCLGEKKKAIKYLNDIIAVRPDYKSAQSLMEKWLKA